MNADSRPLLPGPPPRWGFLVDPGRCTGCHACSVACKVENHVPLGNFRTMVYIRDRGRFPGVTRDFLPVLCQQCEDAPCLKACPTRSISRGPDGIVHVDKKTCEGSGDCVAACPYGALYLDPVTQIADKCDFCSHRLSAGMEPACVETCPAGTLRFGNLNDPLDSLAKFVAAHPEELSVLKPEKGTQPRVLYRNLDRSMEKKVAEGRNHDPRQYEVETWEMEGRLEAPGKPPKGA